MRSSAKLGDMARMLVYRLVIESAVRQHRNNAFTGESQFFQGRAAVGMRCNADVRLPAGRSNDLVIEVVGMMMRQKVQPAALKCTLQG